MKRSCILKRKSLYNVSVRENFSVSLCYATSCYLSAVLINGCVLTWPQYLCSVVASERWPSPLLSASLHCDGRETSVEGYCYTVSVWYLGSRPCFACRGISYRHEINLSTAMPSAMLSACRNVKPHEAYNLTSLAAALQMYWLATSASKSAVK
jgi:hypothetical protein